MSDRYNHYDKGSRSTRDDYRSRTQKDRHWERDQEKERSRSPQPRSSPSRSRRSPESSRDREKQIYEDKHNLRDNEWSDEEIPAPPPPPRISKISIGFSKQKTAPIKMNLGGVAKPSFSAPKPKVASIFGADDDDEEPEEMPAEARMRMRNIGRETPTSAGPNSFGKTKQGFCDAKKVFEKNLKNALETEASDKPSASKLPQTIYKIKGP